MPQILLIEPDRQLAQTYFEVLLEAGHEVVVAPGAQTAILVADEHQPDLIIIELQLVEHSGIEFLYEARSYPEWQNIPVIVNTIIPPAEFNESVDILRAQLGVKHFLYKPHTSLKNLISAVNEELAVKV